MLAVFILCMAFTILSFWRRLHQQWAQMKFESEVSSHLAELNLLVADGKLNNDSWLFQALSTALEETRQDAYYISLFRSIIMELRLKDDESFKKFQEKLACELGEHRAVAEIMVSYRR